MSSMRVHFTACANSIVSICLRVTVLDQVGSGVSDKYEYTQVNQNVNGTGAGTQPAALKYHFSHVAAAVHCSDLLKKVQLARSYTVTMR